MHPERHAAVVEQLIAWAHVTDEVLGIVGVGSTSGERRPDRFSDHDVVIVTSTDAEAARLRHDASLLPLGTQPLLAFTEPDHGLTVILADGHLLEFAICTPDDLGWFAADRHRVLFDRGPVAETLRDVLEARARQGASDGASAVEARMVAHYHHLLKEFIVAIARVGRGERISAHRHLHAAAVDDLLVLVRACVPCEAVGSEDPYDPARRLERSHPAIARRLDAALAEPLESAVRSLATVIREVLVPRLEDAMDEHLDLIEALLDQATAGHRSTVDVAR
ncbi:MAG: hypothetical protein EA340_04525 [Nitriliruptor sp.]|nr:MAG: hypothetical protein EA340_04525 [Nitriliruptor sp.]